MKINEFIERFNELDMPYGETHYKISATKEAAFAHSVVINVFKNNTFQITAARLPEGFSGWYFYGGPPFAPQMLELMAELAKTPPEEREEQPKYVILNGLPRHGKCCYFAISREGQLITSHVDGAGIEKYAAYSQEGLVERKKDLTPEMAAAVDMMTVTLERAIELTEESKHDE